MFRGEDDDEEEVSRLRKRGKVYLPPRASGRSSFLEELKRQESEQGPADRNRVGERQTTNLFVGNMSMQTSEESIRRVFGDFGPLASIKIMWPRNQDELRRSSSKSGFVCYMLREHAELAYNKLHLHLVDGQEIRLSWSKPISLPRAPLPPLPGQIYGGLALPPETTQHERQQVYVAVPTDKTRVVVLNALARDVHQRGQEFEQRIADEDARSRNMQFSFLWNPNLSDSTDSVYFRWKKYSLGRGERPDDWRTEPFVMPQTDEIWHPPPNRNRDLETEAVQTPIVLRQVAEKDAALTDRDADLLAKMLQNLNDDRRMIGEVMVFCIERALQAGNVVSMVASSIISKESSLSTKIVLLYVISDILYNSRVDVKNSWAYRDRFQVCLPECFSTLGMTYGQIQGRMAAKSVEDQIEQVVAAWDRWSIFPLAFTMDLRDRTFRKATIERPNNNSASVVERRSLNKEAQTTQPTSFKSQLDKADEVKTTSFASNNNEAISHRPATVKGNEECLAELRAKNTTPSLPASDDRNCNHGYLETKEQTNQESYMAKQTAREDSRDGKRLNSKTCIDGMHVNRSDGNESLDGKLVDGKQLESKLLDGEWPDGEAPDGEPLDGEPLDGEPLDGEPLDGEPLDGEPLDGEPLDGEPLDGEPLDGEPLDGDQPDGKPLDEEPLDGGQPLDGEPLDGELLDGDRLERKARDDDERR